MFFTSPPAQKALPAPVSRIDPHGGVVVALAIILCSACDIGGDRAFLASGRLKRMVATPSATLHRRSVVPVSRLVSARLWVLRAVVASVVMIVSVSRWSKPPTGVRPWLSQTKHSRQCSDRRRVTWALHSASAFWRFASFVSARLMRSAGKSSCAIAMPLSKVSE